LRYDNFKYVECRYTEGDGLTRFLMSFIWLLSELGIYNQFCARLFDYVGSSDHFCNDHLAISASVVILQAKFPLFTF
jgi:hypothetical protein